MSPHGNLIINSFSFSKDDEEIMCIGDNFSEIRFFQFQIPHCKRVSSVVLNCIKFVKNTVKNKGTKVSLLTLHTEHFSSSSCKNQHACHNMLPSTADRLRGLEVVHSTITGYQAHYALHDLKSLSFDFYFTF